MKKPRKSFREPIKKPTTLGEKIFTHTILIIGCVLLPGFCTLIAPLSVVRLQRAGGDVSADISKRLWFIVPYRHLHVDGVTNADSSFHSGSTSYSHSRREYTKSEDTAFLKLTGRSGEAEAEVSPVNIESTRRKVRDFLEDSTRDRLTLVVVANWKFSVFAGGILSLLTLLYVVGVVGGIFQWLYGLVRGPAAPSIREESASVTAEREASHRLP